MSNLSKILGLSFVLVSFVACSNNLENNEPPSGLSQSELSLKLNGLEAMQGQHYEGWLVTSTGVSSTGRFNMNEEGQIVAVNVAGDELAVLGTDEAVFSLGDVSGNVQDFVLTIEPDNDDDEGPSAVHYLAGSFNESRAVAVIDDSGAIGASFLGAMGTYILATPTNGPSTHNQGIWFVNSGNPSLILPSLNKGWAYEGWVVNTETGEVVSTGVFDTASGADSDGAGVDAGPNAAPPFPGQDFITSPRILNDGRYITVISVEPKPDFDPAPFTLKILADEIADQAAVVTPFDLNNISNENDISIEATIQ